MNKTFGCFIVWLFLSGCDKQKLHLNKIDGEWNIVNYARTNNEGITTKYSNCVGTIDFVAKYTQFDLNIIHQNSGLNDTISASGDFHLIENGSSIIFNNSSGLNLGYEGSYRILTLTSTDLQIEGGDTLGNVNTYLFSRK
jgi:hypothetical protein